MEGVEFLDKGVEGVEGGLACVVVVEISVFIQGPVYCGAFSDGSVECVVVK